VFDAPVKMFSPFEKVNSAGSLSFPIEVSFEKYIPPIHMNLY
jgi:hypothetical protein